MPNIPASSISRTSRTGEEYGLALRLTSIPASSISRTIFSILVVHDEMLNLVE